MAGSRYVLLGHRPARSQCRRAGDGEFRRIKVKRELCRGHSIGFVDADWNTTRSANVNRLSRTPCKVRYRQNAFTIVCYGELHHKVATRITVAVAVELIALRVEDTIRATLDGEGISIWRQRITRLDEDEFASCFVVDNRTTDVTLSISNQGHVIAIGRGVVAIKDVQRGRVDLTLYLDFDCGLSLLRLRYTEAVRAVEVAAVDDKCVAGVCATLDSEGADNHIVDGIVVDVGRTDRKSQLVAGIDTVDDEAVGTIDARQC